MTNNFEAAAAAEQTGDEEFFQAAIRYRDLHEEVQESENELNRLIAQRNNLPIGKLIRLGQMAEIRRLSGEIDGKKEEMKQIVEGLLSKFYPSNSEVRTSLNGVWIGVQPMLAIRFSEDLKSIEIHELQ